MNLERETVMFARKPHGTPERHLAGCDCEWCLDAVKQRAEARQSLAYFEAERAVSRWRGRREPAKSFDELGHGRYYTYRRGCHCDECKAARAEVARTQRAASRERKEDENDIAIPSALRDLV